MVCSLRLRLLIVQGLLAAALACSSSPTDSPQTACGTYEAVVAASDYISSEVGLTSLGGASDYEGGPHLGIDPSLASSAGRHFWIARDLGQILELDTTCLKSKATFDAQDPVPAGSPFATTNPYDVAVAPDGSLWIARFNVPTVLVLNADGTRRTIDLSSQDPVDGNPNMNSIRILDPAAGGAAQSDAGGSMATSKAYVSLEILDDLNNEIPLISTRKSKLVRIDLESGLVEDVLTLAGRNPISSMVQLGNQLYLADAGTWQCASDVCPSGQPDAGIERVDTASFTSRLLVTGETLGGHANELAVTANCGVVIVAGSWPSTPTSLVRFDPTTGDSGTVALHTVIPTTTSFTLSGLAWIGSDVLLVGDRGEAGGTPGAHVFDANVAAGCSLTERASPIPLPLPPVAFAAL
jgi:hypothetical protein